MMQLLDQNFWDERWRNGQTGWDIGIPSPPLCDFARHHPDKTARILIPGCGNAHEAGYLWSLGFTNIDLVDISPLAVQKMKDRYGSVNGPGIYCSDFFDWKGHYDLILEQTFFCALPRERRIDYSAHCAKLLSPGGILAGVLFASQFEQPGPPVGGDADEYRSLFSRDFDILTLEPCYNSIPPRAGNELFVILRCKGDAARDSAV
ncbi:MAG: SAM-dependent methyltransferase [Saprospiraceae bacterium]|nr:SAM-dependent methyltransferase [Saprospiraceae bacterium]